MLAAGDHVQIELIDNEFNREAYPEGITLGWNSKEYHIPVGRRNIVPFEAMSLRFGDPRSGENITAIKTADGGASGWIADRKSEVARLRLLWGAHADNYPRFDDISVPHVVVSTLEHEPITTVIDDPEGKETLPIQQTESDRDSLLALLDRQQAQIDELRQQLNMEAEISIEDDLPSDDGMAPALFGGTGSNQEI